MKKNFLLLLVVMFTSVISLTGCSKPVDSFTLPAEEKSSGTNSVNPGPSGRFASWGTVTGTIYPPGTEVKMVLYNSLYAFSTFTITKAGDFTIGKVPQGIYSLMVINLNTSANYTLDDIKVRPRYTTDVGTISF